MSKKKPHSNNGHAPLRQRSDAASKSPPVSKAAISLKKEWWVLLGIAAVTFASFLPALKNGFLDWDDSGMFLENIEYRGLGWEQIRWMFTTFHYAHYHPITWLTLGLDYTLWGMNPFGYHFSSLIFHALNAVLFYLLLRKLIGVSPAFSGSTDTWTLRLACALGALFFAIHPLRVESVAWITERRDVVSGFFYLLTLLAYMRAQTNGPRKLWLGVALACFVLSFLSKAWGITLPVVLLILDVYPLRRWQSGVSFSANFRKLVVEKIPFALVSIGVDYVAYRGQAEWGIEASDLNLFKRMAIAAFGLSFYFFKTFVPFNLSPLYLLPQPFNPLEARILIGGIASLGITVAVALGWRRWPWAAAAWLCYAVIVSPVIGLTHKGEQIAADRYTYLSGLPFAVLVAAGLALLSQRASRPGNSAAKVGFIFSIVAAVGLGVLTWQQTKVWRSEGTLWEQAIKVEPDNFVAYNGRGRMRLQARNYEGAIAAFNTAIQLNPKKVEPYSNRGMAYHTLGNLDAALADYTTALKIKPFHQTFNNRGALRETRGDIAGAIEDYSLALQLNPRHSTSYFNRARLRKRQGDLAGALADFNLSLKYQPDYADGYLRRGDLLLQQNELAQALRDYEMAQRFAPAGWASKTEVEQRLSQVRAAMQAGGKP